MTGRDTGLNVHHSGNGRRRRRGGPLASFGLNNRTLLLLLAVIVLLIILFIGISSCVSSCSSSSSSDVSSSTTKVNAYDSRVAAGVSESLTNKFTTVLDEGDDLEWIAKHADEYSDERLPELAMRESAAISFVRNVPSADKTATAYEEGTEQGSYPLLYDWDEHWGYVEYAGSNMGVLGSGPTTLSMAYMGLTGNNDQTPDELATLSTEGGYTDETAGTTADFFTNVAPEIGLSIQEYTPSSDNLSAILSSGDVAIVQLNANFTTPYAHWALVVSVNDDESVTLYDPDSTSASTHTWAMGTIADNSSTMFAVGVSDTSSIAADTSTSDTSVS